MNVQILEADQHFLAEKDELGPVVVSKAERPDDFMVVARMMNSAARRNCAPIEPRRIGRILSRLNHGGSGAKTGCVILARSGDQPTGFALLLVKPRSGLELTWLHVESGDDRAIHGLWKMALETKRSWNYPTLRVRTFAHLPSAMIAAFYDHTD